MLAHEGLSLWTVRMLGRIPGLTNVAAKMEEMLVALRRCVAPWPLFLTIVLSVIAWGAECYGYQLVFQGLGYDNVSLEVCVFLYAFATVAGGAMPGGLGRSGRRPGWRSRDPDRRHLPAGERRCRHPHPRVYALDWRRHRCGRPHQGLLDARRHRARR